MAIIGFCGTPGSGKTYEAVQKILDNLSRGRVVYTNIDGMQGDLCKEMIKGVTGLSDLALEIQLKELDHEQIFDFWNHVQPKSLIVLDEVQNFFGSREWQSEKNQIFGRWASVHRHHGFEVVIITQNIERIDAAVRSLCEWTYVFRKVNFFGNLVQQSYMCYGYGGDEARGKPLTTQKRSYDKNVFLCYKSYVADDIKEQGIMKHVNVLKHPVFYAIPVVLCFTLYMVFFKSSFADGDIFGAQKAITQAEQLRNKKRPTSQQPPPSHVASEKTGHAPSIMVRRIANKLILSNRG